MLSTITSLIPAVLATAACAASPAGDAQQIRAYTLDRPVADFPVQDDFSSPEAAYATINRHMADGDANWRAMSVSRLARNMPAATREKVSAKAAEEWRSARIIEVRMFGESFAAAFARTGKSIDIRSFELENGKWLNAGNDVAPDLAAARQRFARMASSRISPPRRNPVEDPQAYLKPYIESLSKAGVVPKDFVLSAIESHKLTVIGEIHHRPTYWALHGRIVQDPRFAAAAGVVYMELPCHAQTLVDRFLAAESLDTAPVIEMLRDNLWMGWPDQAMLEFFEVVWKTNQGLPPAQRIRIMLVDMARPWKDIRQGTDFRKHDVDRDQWMSQNILKDLAAHGQDQRHALFIVGYAHAETLKLAAGGEPLNTAGVHLRAAMGRDLYTIVQHGPVLANMGGVSGRTCLGLFDAAFAANGHQPVAFALADSPFGTQRFDANADVCAATTSSYQEAFDAYLYLGPLEEEAFSSLIDGFYTDEFVKELDRRYRLQGSRGLKEGLRLPALDAKSFVAWMGQSWGRPRDWRDRLGPIDAWQYGDDWQKIIQARQQRLALDQPDIARAAARRLLQALQSADYQSPEKLWQLDYTANRWYDVWVQWVCEHFGKNPIKDIELGEVIADKAGRPVVAYALLLADGSRMEGKLPMEFQPLAGRWRGVEGLDWHLLKGSTTRPAGG